MPAIVDDFTELNKQCKKLFPKVFDNAAMTPSKVVSKKKMCLECRGKGYTLVKLRSGPVRVDCLVCEGTGIEGAQQ